MKDVDIGLLIPSTHLQVTVEVVEICLLIPATLPQVITEDILVEVYPVHKRPATLPLVIWEQYFMLKVEADIDLIQESISIMTKVAVVDCWFLQYLEVV